MCANTNDALLNTFSARNVLGNTLKTHRRFHMKMQKMSLLSLVAALLLVSFNAMAACGDQVLTKLTAPAYANLNAILTPAQVTKFKNKLNGVTGAPTYNSLLNEANTVAALIANGRVLITLPDGTVVVDTSKGANNTYANFQAKTINENHNSRIAILDAQLWACGVGLETKTSTSTGDVEVYLAKRLGAYLDSAGTVRLSHK
jgi:hypothetical protein